MINRVVFLIILSASWCHTAQQGNYKYNNYGNRSILLTGNVTGSVSDIGLMYYNPARLTSIETSGIAFNAKAYQFNSIEIDPLITDNDPISRNSFTTVPALVGGTFKLFGERFAYTFLSKYRTNRTLSASYNRLNETVLENFPDAQALFLSASISNEIRDDWYGLSWAHKFENDLSIGISVFGADYKYRGLRSSNRTFEYEPNKVSTGLIQYSFDQQSYGLHVKLGANYSINNVDLGINLHLPYLEVHGSGKYRLNQTVAGSIDGRDKFYDYDLTDLNSARKIPLGISAGAGISINKSQIHINIDYRDGLSEYQRLELPMVDLGNTSLTEITFNERRYAVLNFGIGGELFISEKLQSFFGFSTDFNSYRGETEFFDFRTSNADELNAGTDYFHLSGGVDWELKWGSIIFGLTFTRGKNNISLNSDPLTGLIADFNNTTAVVSHRLQFIVGFEIPFLDKGVKNFRDNFNFN